MLLLPFIDIGVGQDPMLSQNLPAWGRTPARVPASMLLLRAAFGSGVDWGQLAAAVTWLAALTAAAAAVFWRISGDSRARRTDPARHPLAVPGDTDQRHLTNPENTPTDALTRKAALVDKSDNIRGMSAVLAWISGSGVVQGLIIGATLAYLTAILIMNGVGRTITTTVNGWSAIRKCGQIGNGVFVRAACAKALPVVNVFEEAAYWTTAKDGSGQALSGTHEYVLHFAAAQLPPNGAFWSLTPTDVAGYMVRNPADRNSVGGRSDLTTGADGSIDIYLQQKTPKGHEQNWLPTPSGDFKLMLRAYLPGASILDGTYRVPAVVKTH